MSEQSERLNALLDKCYNEDCHEGTLSVLGKEVIVFTKEPQYDEEGEVTDYGGDKGAFITNQKGEVEFWTGWYEQDLGNDLKEVMLSVVEVLFGTTPVECTFEGTISEGYRNYNPNEKDDDGDPAEDWDYGEDNNNINDDTLKSNIEEVMDRNVGRTTTITQFDRQNGTFSGTFSISNTYTLKDFFDENEDGVGTVSYEDYIEEATYKVKDPSIAQFFKEAFSYTISF